MKPCFYPFTFLHFLILQLCSIPLPIHQSMYLFHHKYKQHLYDPYSDHLPINMPHPHSHPAQVIFLHQNLIISDMCVLASGFLYYKFFCISQGFFFTLWTKQRKICKYRIFPQFQSCLISAFWAKNPFLML